MSHEDESIRLSNSFERPPLEALYKSAPTAARKSLMTTTVLSTSWSGKETAAAGREPNVEASTAGATTATMMVDHFGGACTDSEAHALYEYTATETLLRLPLRALNCSKQEASVQLNVMHADGAVVGMVNGQNTLQGHDHSSLPKSSPLNSKLENSPSRGQNMRESLTQIINSSKVSQAYLQMASFLLVVLHPSVSTTMFSIFDCDAIYHRKGYIQYWLSSDRQMQCFSTMWWVYAWLALIVILVYIIGMPVAMLMILYHFKQQKLVMCGNRTKYCYLRSLRLSRKNKWFSMDDEVREEVKPFFVQSGRVSVNARNKSLMVTRLDSLELRRLIGPIYCDFQRPYWWFSSYEIFQKLFQTSFVTLVNLVNPDYGIVYGLIVAITSLMIQASYSPYCCKRDNQLRSLVLYSQCVLMCFCMFNLYIAKDDYASLVFGSILIYFQCVICLMTFWLLLKILFHQLHCIKTMTSKLRSILKLCKHSTAPSALGS
eukprot:gene5775-6965_t